MLVDALTVDTFLNKCCSLPSTLLDMSWLFQIKPQHYPTSSVSCCDVYLTHAYFAYLGKVPQGVKKVSYELAGE